MSGNQFCVFWSIASIACIYETAAVETVLGLFCGDVLQLWHRGSTREKKLGSTTVPISVILTADTMSAVQQLAMPDVSPSCMLTVHLTLRVRQHICCLVFS